MIILEIRDNPKHADRYTVVYDEIADHNGNFESLGMNAEPFHPQGIGQHGAAETGPHLGTKIEFDDLPEDCQQAVIQDLDYDPRTTPDPYQLSLVLDRKARHIYDLRTQPTIKNWYLRRHTKQQLIYIAAYMALDITRRTTKPELMDMITNHNRTLAYIRNHPTPAKTIECRWHGV